MDKSTSEQVGSPATVESVSSDVESSQPRLDSMGDDGFFLGGNLSAEVVRRVNALRNLQAKHHQIESKFFEEVHELECRYQSKYQSLYEKRSNIVKGSYEPTAEEAKCTFDGEETDEQTKKSEEEDKTVGIPEFWLTVLKNSDAVAELIKEQDEEVLKHLIDVRITMQNENGQKGFTIEFEFTPNEYFTNTLLTKFYELRTTPDELEPLSYEGPEIVKSKGCEIQWNKGKNITVKMVKKKQKHKNRGTIRVVTKEVQTDSFFNFFSPPSVPEDPDAEVEDNEEMSLLAADFEMGHMFRDSIVPKAVLYYTGEVGDEEDDDYDEEGEDDDDDDDDDEDDNDDEEEEAAPRGGKHGKSRGGKQGGGGAAGQQQPECKQQ